MSCDYKFYLMRHGLKSYENGRGPQGSPAFDPPLQNTLGILEAAHALRERRVKQLLTSPLLRCRETAEAVATELKLFRPINTAFEFREYLGNWVKEQRKQPFDNNYFDVETKRRFDLLLTKSEQFKSYRTNSIKIFENDFNMFKERIRKLADTIKQAAELSNRQLNETERHHIRYRDECIITHAVVIEHLLNELKCPINKKLITPATVIEITYFRGIFQAQIIASVNINEKPIVESYDSEKTLIVDSDEELLISLNDLDLEDFKFDNER